MQYREDYDLTSSPVHRKRMRIIWLYVRGTVYIRGAVCPRVYRGMVWDTLLRGTYGMFFGCGKTYPGMGFGMGYAQGDTPGMIWDRVLNDMPGMVYARYGIPVWYTPGMV